MLLSSTTEVMWASCSVERIEVKLGFTLGEYVETDEQNHCG